MTIGKWRTKDSIWSIDSQTAQNEISCAGRERRGSRYAQKNEENTHASTSINCWFSFSFLCSCIPHRMYTSAGKNIIVALNRCLSGNTPGHGHQSSPEPQSSPQHLDHSISYATLTFPVVYLTCSYRPLPRFECTRTLIQVPGNVLVRDRLTQRENVLLKHQSLLL